MGRVSWPVNGSSTGDRRVERGLIPAAGQRHPDRPGPAGRPPPVDDAGMPPVAAAAVGVWSRLHG